MVARSLSGLSIGINIRIGVSPYDGATPSMIRRQGSRLSSTKYSPNLKATRVRLGAAPLSKLNNLPPFEYSLSAKPVICSSGAAKGWVKPFQTGDGDPIG